MERDTSIELAVELTMAWLGNANTRIVAPSEVSDMLTEMHQKVQILTNPSTAPSPKRAEPEYEAATTVRKSLASPDYIISMIDGLPYKTLRRHLTKHGLTPEEYRNRYGLKPDYPMVAPTYSEARRAMAKKIGLGTKENRGQASA